MKIYLLAILSIISISHPNFVFSNDLTDLEGKLLTCKRDRVDDIDVNLRFINRKYVLFERIEWNHTEKYNYYRFEKPRENYIPYIHINYTNGSCPTERGAGNRTTYYKLRGDGLSLEHCDRGSWMRVSFCKIKGNIDKDELKLLLKIYGDTSEKKNNSDIKKTKQEIKRSKDCNSNNLTYFELNQCKKDGKISSHSQTPDVKKRTPSYAQSDSFSKFDSELEMTCIFLPNALSPSGSHVVYQKKGNYIHHEGKKDLIIETDKKTNKRFIIKNDSIYRAFGFYSMIDFANKRLYLNENKTTEYNDCF